MTTTHDLARVLLVVVAILGLSRALAPVARRLGQPLVVAEIVAGIVLGPSLLGWLAPPALEWLLPPSSVEGLRLLSQLGLVLFMFLVGLELDPKLLRGRAHTPALVGVASFVIPFAGGLLFARWLHASHGEGSLGAFSAFIAAATATTAFPVLARILSERHLLTTRIGAIAIACAAVDDVVAWAVVTWLVAVARADDWAPAVLVGGLAVVIAVAMALALRPVIERAIKRVDRHGPGPGAVGAVLFVLLLLCAGWELLGVHAFFGAFLFGAVLPKEGALAELLVDKLETLATVVLLPIFFAYSGLRTQLVLVDQPADWLAMAVMVLVATATKLGGSALVARSTGLPWRESTALGILLNARGLIGLIVANVGLDLGVVSPTVFTMLIVTALVTTAMTGPLLRLVYPDRAIIEERFAEEVTPPQADSGDARDVLLACISDPSSGAGLAATAHALVGERRGEGAVFGLHLLRPTDRASTELRRDPELDPAPLAAFLQPARALALAARPLSFVSGAPADDIVRIAAAKRASLVLLGAHDPWWLEGRLDGVVADVIEHARATVCVLVGADRPAPERGFERILVARAHGEDDVTLAIAARLAARATARVTILDIAAPGGGREERAGAVRGCDTRRVEHASPYEALLEAARGHGYDLVVVSAARHWRVSSDRLGRSRTSLFQAIDGPLLVVHEGGDGAPSREVGA